MFTLKLLSCARKTSALLCATREKLLCFCAFWNDDDDDGDDDDEFVVVVVFPRGSIVENDANEFPLPYETKVGRRTQHHHHQQRRGGVKASGSDDDDSDDDDGRRRRKVLLEVRDLKARVAETGEEILKGVDLIVREGETHAVMGKNRSGKSTLTKVLVGHPAYEVTGGYAKYKGEDLLEMEPEDRAREGLFLSFQSPVEVPGVSNTDFLRMMCNERRKRRGEEEMDPLEFYGYLSPKLDKLNMDPSFMTRNVNEGFSGGEKKRNEILQLAVLESEMSMLDEIDSGLTWTRSAT